MRDRLALWAAMGLSYAVAAVTGAWCGWLAGWQDLRVDVAWTRARVHYFNDSPVREFAFVYVALSPVWLAVATWTGARDAVRAVRRDWQASARPVYELCPDCDRFPYSRCPTCGA